MEKQFSDVISIPEPETGPAPATPVQERLIMSNVVTSENQLPGFPSHLNPESGGDSEDEKEKKKKRQESESSDCDINACICCFPGCDCDAACETEYCEKCCDCCECCEGLESCCDCFGQCCEIFTCCCD